MDVSIELATAEHAPVLAELTKELLEEINQRTNETHFTMESTPTAACAGRLLASGTYFAFVAKDVATDTILGFLALCPCNALYAGGDFGIITEFYVRSMYRSQGIGTKLLEEASHFGRDKGWTQLEVTTPPILFFRRTVHFYEKQGFCEAGGKKLKRTS